MQPGERKTFAEFFAGIGLVREGLARSNWQCVYANDFNEKKKQIYEARFGATEHFHLADVWDTEEVVKRLSEPSTRTHRCLRSDDVRLNVDGRCHACA